MACGESITRMLSTPGLRPPPDGVAIALGRRVAGDVDGVVVGPGGGQTLVEGRHGLVGQGGQGNTHVAGPVGVMAPGPPPLVMMASRLPRGRNLEARALAA